MGSEDKDYGPQNPKDASFQRRMRFHQSWYRAEVLNVPYGVGPKRKSKTLYGNMLREADGNRGLNFLTPHIFQVAQRRLALKTGGIDDFRLLNNLLSSQPMCFNLFGPLVDDLKLARRVLGALLPVEIHKVQKVMLEFAPQPTGDYLNDRTAFDAYVSYERTDGRHAFLGIETKLSEPLSQKIYANPRYWHWTRLPDSPWREDSWSQLQTLRFNQLWRDHLLAIANKGVSPLGFSSGGLLLVYHPSDTEMAATVNAYRELLKPGDESFMAIPLDQLVENWRGVIERSTERDWLDDFSQRYLDLQASEAEFFAQKSVYPTTNSV